MTEPPVTEDARDGICKFPECDRPVPRTGTPGRPPEYCDLPEHTRWRAWKERQRRQPDGVTDSTVSVTVTEWDGPVSAARTRAEDLLRQYRSLSEQMSRTLTSAIGELRSIADPSVAEAQIHAVHADAAQRVAAAEHALATAQQQRRDAEDARDSAVAAADDAGTAAEESERRVQKATAERDAAQHQAGAAESRAEDEIATARNEYEVAVAAARHEADDEIALARHRAETAEAEADQKVVAAQDESRRGIAEHESARAAAEQRAARAEQSAEHAVESLAEAKQELSGSRAEVSEVRAELRSHRAETERIRERHTQELGDLRAEAAESLRHAQDDAAQRVSAVDEARQHTLTRAERAETQLDTALAELRAVRERLDTSAATTGNGSG